MTVRRAPRRRKSVDWVLHFNERGPDGLLNGKSPGQPSKLNDVQRQAIARIIESALHARTAQICNQPSVHRPG
jgi:transposase